MLPVRAALVPRVPAAGSVRPATLEDIDAVTGPRADAEAALYRATVEAPPNARVHAAATRVTVKLNQDAARLEIVDGDNGITVPRDRVV